MYTRVGACGVQNGVSDPLDLEFQTAVNNLPWCWKRSSQTAEPSLQALAQAVFKCGSWGLNLGPLTELAPQPSFLSLIKMSYGRHQIKHRLVFGEIDYVSGPI